MGVVIGATLGPPQCRMPVGSVVRSCCRDRRSGRAPEALAGFAGAGAGQLLPAVSRGRSCGPARTPMRCARLLSGFGDAVAYLA